MARPDRGAASLPAAALLLCLGSLLLLAAPAAGVRQLAQDQANGGGGGGGATNASDPFASIVEPLLGGDQTQNATQPAAGNVKFGLAPGVGAPGGEPRLRFTGIATVAYEDQPITPFGAAKLGCSLGFVSPTFQSNYVGVSSDLLQQGQACGRCIKIQCDDVSCKEPGKVELPAIVADVCGSCTRSDLAISAPLFRNVTGRDAGSSPSIVMSWDVVECAPYTEGTIKMLLKEGGSAYYQAFGFSNSAQPILAVQVNGQRLTRSSAGWWDWNPGQPITPSAPLEVALQGGNREVLRARVPSMRNADLGVQFKAS